LIELSEAPSAYTKDEERVILHYSEDEKLVGINARRNI